MGGLVGGGIKVAVGVFGLPRIYFGFIALAIGAILSNINCAILMSFSCQSKVMRSSGWPKTFCSSDQDRGSSADRTGARRGHPSTGDGCRCRPPPLSTCCPTPGCPAVPGNRRWAWSRLVDPERRTADKARRAVVEVVGVEVVDADAVAARADKRIGIGVFVENGLDGGHVLVGEVTPTTLRRSPDCTVCRSRRAASGARCGTGRRR